MLRSKVQIPSSAAAAAVAVVVVVVVAAAAPGGAGVIDGDAARYSKSHQ